MSVCDHHAYAKFPSFGRLGINRVGQIFLGTCLLVVKWIREIEDHYACNFLSTSRDTTASAAVTCLLKKKSNASTVML